MKFKELEIGDKFVISDHPNQTILIKVKLQPDVNDLFGAEYNATTQSGEIFGEISGGEKVEKK